MIKAKRILSVIVAIVLCLCFTSTAFASNSSKSTKYVDTLPTTAAYSSSQSFLESMDDNQIKYTYQGLDRDDDWIEIKYSGDYCDLIDIDVFFSSSADRASFRFWNIIDFNRGDYQKVLEVVNQLNAQYKWVKFVVDTSDYSVTAELDVLFPVGSAGSICLESLSQIVDISDLGYKELAPYSK